MSETSNIGLTVIDRWLGYRARQGDWPGLQVSIRKGADLIFNRAYGFAHIEKKEKYTPDHLGRLGSQSKVFTATLGLLLESEGVLQLDKPIASYVVELQRHPDPRLKRITLLDLLSHRGELIRDSYERNYWKPGEPFPTSAELLSELMGLSLVGLSGKNSKYSNMGFALAGLAFERATGKTFNELVRQKLIKRNALSPNYDKTLKMAQGYIRDQTGESKFKALTHFNTKSLTPAAGFCGNTMSTTHWFHNVYQTTSVLQARQQKRLLTSHWPVQNEASDQYGFGTIFGKIKNTAYIGHSGGVPGFVSQTWVLPKANFTIGLCINLNVTKTLNIVSSIYEILKAVQTEFGSSERKSLIVSEPIADNYGSTIYVLGKKRAIAFPLSPFSSVEDMMIFNNHKGKFHFDKMSGYSAVQEPVQFILKKRQIAAVRFGGFTAYPLVK